MKAKQILIGAGAAVAAVGLVGLMGAASAQTPTADTNTLVDKIAQRFSLNKNDVQKVFDENHQARQATIEAKYEVGLSQAVTDGKLTAAQKDLILAKHKGLIGLFASFRDITPAERKAAMNAKHDEITAWETENNIPTGYLMPFGHHGESGMGGHHGDFGKGIGMMHGSRAGSVNDKTELN